MRVNAFKFAPFSPKQKAALTWWIPGSKYCDYDGIVCDGAIRSGKTTAMSLSYVLWAMETFSAQDERDGQNFGICGKTIQSLRRNVIKQLLQMLHGLGYTTDEHRTENYITISRGDTTNDFYLFGGKDESSQALIQGITLAGCFFDEVALMPESFVNQATGRCSVEGSKFWFNCNPEGPDHYFKVEWIDKLTAKHLIRIHFEMTDNLSLAEDIIERYKRNYTGVFYDRFILGLWVLASGIIFRYFADNPEPFLTDDEECKGAYSKITMGIDFGGNGSKTVFCLMGYRNGYKEFRVLEEMGLQLEGIGANEICDAFITFYKKAIRKYGRVDWVFADSASPTLINSLIAKAKESGLRWGNIKGCRKNEVSERPKTFDLLLNSGRLKVNRRCKEIIKALKNLRWDEDHPDRPEDKNIGNVNDYWDALNYCILDFIEFIDLKR